MPDVRAVEEVIAIHLVHSLKSLAVSRLEIRGRSKNHQYTAAICHQRMAGLVV